MQPIMARRPDGTLSMMCLPPEFSAFLLEIPSLMDADDRPEAQSRLYPHPTADDDEANAEWERMMHPDLFHLIAAARDIVVADLKLLRRTRKLPTGGQLNIPADHCNAWISAIQTVRSVLGATHGFDAEDMEDISILSEPGERSGAMMRLHVLGDVQGLLISESQLEPGGGSPDDAATDDDEYDDDDDFDFDWIGDGTG